MTQSFDEWFEKQGMADCYGKSSEEYKVSLFVWTRQQAEIEELRKRIEKTEKWVESNKRNIPLSEWHGYTTEEYVDADDLLDIIKGKTNEQ